MNLTRKEVENYAITDGVRLYFETTIDAKELLKRLEYYRKLWMTQE